MHRALARWLEPGRLRWYAASVLAVACVLGSFAWWTARDGMTVFGSLLGGDFAAFYVAGKILNEFGGARLYDLALQEQLYREVLPGAPAGSFLPFAYPPLIAGLFRPLALLPFAGAVGVWWGVALALFVGATGLLLRSKAWQVNGRGTTAWWLALAFEPFLFETWLGGQLSVIGLASVCLGLWCLRRHGALAAGLAFGLCWYKPTLFVVLVPLWLVLREFKVLAGVALTGVLLAGVTWLLFPVEAVAGYVNMLLTYGREVGGGTNVFRTWKFIDLLSTGRLMGWPVWLAGGLAAIGGVALLVYARGERRLVWAAGLTLTLVLNLYAGFYDAVLLVPAALWTTEVMLERQGRLPASLQWWLVALVVGAWISQELAQRFGFQVFTFLVAGFGVYQLALARRVGQDAPA